MSINCFTFVYKTLIRLGYPVPSEFDCEINGEPVTLTAKDMPRFIAEEKMFLKQKLHIAFFESFCEPVEEAQENDIIIHNKGIGLAVNKYKFVTINDRSGERCLENIGKKNILRVPNG